MNCVSCHSEDKTKLHDELQIEICSSCSYLIENLALRPDMWHRLSLLVGPNEYLLHDDFYGDDGYPYAAEILFDEKDYKLHCIKRGEPYSSADKYLEDVLTRFILFEDEIVIPSNVAINELTKLLTHIIETTEIDDFRYKSYLLLSKIDKSAFIQTFIQKRWAADRNEYWHSIASCIIQHFEVEDAKNLLIEAISSEGWRYPNDSLKVLSNFGNKVGIEILKEVFKKREFAITYDIGTILRCCNPSWDTLKGFIDGGRPLSIVAIDALWIEDSPQYTKFFERQSLNDIVVSKEDLEGTLNEYLKVDDAPRVKKAVSSVKARYEIN